MGRTEARQQLFPDLEYYRGFRCWCGQEPDHLVVLNGYAPVTVCDSCHQEHKATSYYLNFSYAATWEAKPLSLRQILKEMIEHG
jgi:hypothetical protein